MGTPSQAALTEALARRTGPVEALAADPDTIVEACRAVATRFRRGGKLVVVGEGGAATDAQHVAVEFTHPVIVGKRALPAIALTADVATVSGIALSADPAAGVAAQVRLLADPADIVLALSWHPPTAATVLALTAAHELGALTVFAGAVAAEGITVTADHVIGADSGDPRVVKEVLVTAYHLLWELVHVYLEQPGVLEREVLVD